MKTQTFRALIIAIGLSISACAYANSIIICVPSEGRVAGPSTLMSCEGTADATLGDLYKNGYHIIQVLELPLQVDKAAIYYLEK